MVLARFPAAAFDHVLDDILRDAFAPPILSGDYRPQFWPTLSRHRNGGTVAPVSNQVHDRPGRGRIGVLSEIDSMTMSAPWTRVNFGGANQPKRLGRKEPNNDHYRMRLLPGLPTSRFCGYRNCSLSSGSSPIHLRSSPPQANFSAVASRQRLAPGPVLASLAQCANSLVPAAQAQAKLSPPST
jgi:hypothetical protein